jgi:hypothetical protein
MGTHLGLVLEITNTSGRRVMITPLRVKVIHEDGTESQTIYDLTRKSLEEIDYKGGDVLDGRLSVANPNRSEPVQSGSTAWLSKDENVVLNLSASKSDPDKVQVSLGTEGSSEQELFVVTR